MTATAPEIQIGMPLNGDALAHARPPGDRYFRHPGDVVRLVLWGTTLVLLAIFLSVADATSAGVSTDLGRVASQLPDAVREFFLTVAQVGGVLVPVVIAALLVWQRRWRRIGVGLLGAAAGLVVFAAMDLSFDIPRRVADAVDTETWVASSRFPSLAYVAAVAGAMVVGKPWLSRSWRRASDLALVALVLVIAIAGTAGLVGLLLAVAAGFVGGLVLLIAFGAPNRRPTPVAVVAALDEAGVHVVDLTLQRADGGRAQLYAVADAAGARSFVKVYDRDSRDADVLYRGYRALLFRNPTDEWSSGTLEREVEHEAFMLLVARRGGSACPDLEVLTALQDGSMVLATQHVEGRRLSELAPEDIDDDLLDAVWRQASVLHRNRLAHRALHPSNILVAAGAPVVVDFAAAQGSASPRAQAIDRAELLASLAAMVGSERAVASAARVLDSDALASAAPYLQPLALAASTRKQASKALLQELRSGIAETTGTEPAPLERLVRVRPRTLFMIAALTGAFYILLPQLANVDDSFTALRSANYAWLFVAVVMSAITYFASALGLMGGVHESLPLLPTTEAALASSFVNRVTPANVGGMALNVRYMQKAGIPPAEAVAGMGLNVLAGGVVHFVLLFVFFFWAGKGNAGFKLPSSSRLLVIIVVLLVVAGLVAATRRGRKLVRTHVFTFLHQSARSIASLATSPMKLLFLFGGSFGVTIAYVGALAASSAAYDGGVTFAEVGAVYTGASLLAAAAPTPGGLGAMEAALVAGFTGLGMESGVAVAVVLSYRLVTFWLPILPGWASFHLLERRNLI